MKHDMELFEKGLLEKFRNLKLRCPICKRKTQFRQFDLNCNGGYGYIQGYYARAYRCEKCNVLVVKTEEEIK